MDLAYSISLISAAPTHAVLPDLVVVLVMHLAAATLDRGIMALDGCIEKVRG
jgi:hypothetical protein